MKKNDLILKFINNNKLDLENVIHEYSGYVYTVVENMSNKNLSTEDIEEVISDVFLAVWNNQYKMDLNKELKPYLSAIARNLTRNKFRNLRIELNIVDYENDLYCHDIPDNLIEQKEKSILITNALEKLDNESYIIFTLYYYEFYKIKDISKKLEISQAKVKTKLHRIRKSLKKVLIGEG